MYNVSSRYRAKIKEQSNVCAWYGKITTGKNDAAVVYNIKSTDIKDGSGRITRECAESDKIQIGTAFAGQADVAVYLDYDNGKYYLDGKEVTTYRFYDAVLELTFRLYLSDSPNDYEDVPCGIFTVSEAKRKANVLYLTAYDNMLKFDKKTDPTLYPTTAGSCKAYDWILAACNACDITLAPKSFSLFVNYDYDLTLPEDTTIETWREIIGHVCACICAFATINRDGELEIKTFETNTITDNAYKLTSRNRYDSDAADYISIYVAIMAYNEATKTDEFYTASGPVSEDDLFDVLIYNFGDNPFAQFEDDTVRTNFFIELCDFLSQRQFLNVSASIPSNPAYDVGDMIKFYDNQFGAETRALDTVGSVITQFTVNIGSAADIKCGGENPYTQKVQGRIGSAVDSLEKKTDEGGSVGPTGFTLHDVKALENLDANQTVWVNEERSLYEYYKFSGSPSPASLSSYRSNCAFDDEGNIYFPYNQNIYKKNMEDENAPQIYNYGNYAVDFDRELIAYRNSNSTMFFVENLITGAQRGFSCSSLSFCTYSAEHFSLEYVIVYTLQNSRGYFDVYDRKTLTHIMSLSNSAMTPCKDGTYSVIIARGSTSNKYTLYHNNVKEREISIEHETGEYIIPTGHVTNDKIIFCSEKAGTTYSYSIGYVKIGESKYNKIMDCGVNIRTNLGWGRFDPAMENLFFLDVGETGEHTLAVIDVSSMQLKDKIKRNEAAVPSSNAGSIDFVEYDGHYYYHTTAENSIIYKDQVAYVAQSTDTVNTGIYYGYVKKAIKQYATGDVEVLLEEDKLNVTENKSYTPEIGHVYGEVNVNVPQTDVGSLNITENGTYTAEEGEAYSPVVVNVPQTDVEPLNVSENGTYTASQGEAYSPVVVNVPQTDIEPLNVSENGTYTAPSGEAYSPVVVNVPQTDVEPLNVSQNGTYTAPSGEAYSPVVVNVPQTTVEQLNVSQNGTYTPQSGKAYGPVVVNVPGPTLEEVTVTRNGTIQAGAGSYSDVAGWNKIITDVPMPNDMVTSTVTALENLSKYDNIIAKQMRALSPTPKYTFPSSGYRPQAGKKYVGIDENGYFYFLYTNNYVYRININNPGSIERQYSSYTILSLYDGILTYYNSSNYYIKCLINGLTITIARSIAPKGIEVSYVNSDYIQVLLKGASSSSNIRRIYRIVNTTGTTPLLTLSADAMPTGYIFEKDTTYVVALSSSRYNMFKYDSEDDTFYQYKTVYLSDDISTTDAISVGYGSNNVIFCFDSSRTTFGYIKPYSDDSYFHPILKAGSGISSQIGDSYISLNYERDEVTLYDRSTGIAYLVSVNSSSGADDIRITRVANIPSNGSETDRYMYNMNNNYPSGDGCLWRSSDALKLSVINQKAMFAEKTDGTDVYIDDDQSYYYSEDRIYLGIPNSNVSEGDTFNMQVFFRVFI